jgi:hypothetical protein
MKIGNINGEMAEIRDVHGKSQIDYRFPALTVQDEAGNIVQSPLFPIQRAISEQGQFLAAAAVKVEAEVYLFVNHDAANPQQLWDAVQALQSDVVSRAKEIGFDQLHACVPPELVKSFGKRLEEMGWSKTRPWPIYTLELR